MNIVDSVYRALVNPRCYFDYASHTPLDREAYHAMREVMIRSTHAMWGIDRGFLGNTSADHAEGIQSSKIIENARISCARSIGVKPHEIIFTSGGTESNNIAILGSIGIHEINQKDYSDIHIVTSTIEHSSVRETISILERKGAKVDWVPVNADGLIRMDILKQVITPNTNLVSIMYVNNEIGSIMPIRDIAKHIRHICNKDKKSVLHVDASQAGLLSMDFGSMGVDLATLDGTKIYGPHIGMLYVRHGTNLKSIFFGGDHEYGLRPGSGDPIRTHGFARALDIATTRRLEYHDRIGNLRQYFIETLDRAYSSYLSFHLQKSSIPISPYTIHGSTGSHQSPHIINIGLPGHDAEYIMFALDARGIAVSTKSACERDGDNSQVLSAMGIQSGISLRISFGRYTSYRDIDRLVETLIDVLPLARSDN